MDGKLLRLPCMGVLLGFVGLALTLCPAAAGANKPRTLNSDPNLVGWWTFDEGSGDTTADSSKHGRAGTLRGGMSFEKNSAPGKACRLGSDKAGRALEFDGRDDYVEIAKYKGVTGTRPRTIAAWIKTTSPKGEIVSWGADGPGQMWTFGFIRGHLGVTPKGGYLYMKAATHDDQWHHVAVVVEPAKSPNLYNNVKLYKDGARAEIDDIGLLDLWPIQTGSDLDVRIGRQFKGFIDDLRIYNRALSEHEVNLLFKLQGDHPLPDAANSSIRADSARKTGPMPRRHRPRI
jgi:Concanavalin A-like lectin/glucanases superfamily